jgi:hypothetical protein
VPSSSSSRPDRAGTSVALARTPYPEL